MRTFKLFALAGSAFLAAALATPALALDPAPNSGQTQIETEFLTGMVPHHRSAVVMANMVLDKGTHAELKTMARHIIDDQQMEIAKMSQWLQDWYGLEPPSGTMMPTSSMSGMMPMLHGRMPDMEAAMKDLNNRSGADFEVAFLSAMSHHHAEAIMMTGPVLMGGHHADLFTLAENIAVSQGEEIRQMDQWLQSWYGVQRPLEDPVMAMPMGS